MKRFGFSYLWLVWPPLIIAIPSLARAVEAVIVTGRYFTFAPCGLTPRTLSMTGSQVAHAGLRRTGFHKVPSLRGVWMRDVFGHEGCQCRDKTPALLPVSPTSTWAGRR